jgi:hypothetical protein
VIPVKRAPEHDEITWGRDAERKRFFFEKKKQKTFDKLARACEDDCGPD